MTTETVTATQACGAFLADGGRCESTTATRTLDGDWLEFTCCECGDTAMMHVRHASPEMRRQALEERAGFPERFAHRRFIEDEQNRGMLFHLRAWVRDYATWRSAPLGERGDVPKAPAIFGEQGRGKTHALVAWCRLVIGECGSPVMFRSAAGLLDDLQHAFGDSAEGRLVWERATTVEILALDDLGAEDPTAWRIDRLARLVDERYQHERPILVATNFAPAMWERGLGDERTVSRLRAMTAPVELKGRDRRQQSLEVSA